MYQFGTLSKIAYNLLLVNFPHFLHAFYSDIRQYNDTYLMCCKFSIAYLRGKLLDHAGIRYTHTAVFLGSLIKYTKYFTKAMVRMHNGLHVSKSEYVTNTVSSDMKVNYKAPN